MRIKRLFVCLTLVFIACGNDQKKTDTPTKTSETIQETTVGLSNGRWINENDKNAGIEIKNGKFIMFTKEAERTVNTIYNSYELDEKDGIEYLTLKNESGQMIIYGLLEYSDDSMVLSYLDRGSTLTYKKEK